MKKLIIILSLIIILTSSKKAEHGRASYYHSKFEGRKTASGEIFTQNGLTAACNVFPLGTTLKVTNTQNQKHVIVKVNDRMGTNKRIIDLTRLAAEKLGFISSGTANVKIEEIN